MDKEEANFKTDLEESFNEIILPISSEASLKEALIAKWKFYYVRFDRATKGADLASEYKSSVTVNLHSFAIEEISKMYTKNREKIEGEYFFFFLPFC